ncbi:MATE family efflux transporter [Dickeya sp. CFBP 2040]|uniref:MATE family efflux transporter n=1 Tax=Dickeya sp. CFBP 2040 TaxID=2718531 RepID=UPI0014485BD3|nr:MATE family efflux transporter [Dickeya sp. CFBP 2040]NKI73706.1 MATE family efflux transporter [Dickeya sp. CFBP 2040]
MNTTPDIALPQRQSVGRDISDLIKLSWPMVIVAFAVSLAQNIQTAILGHGNESTSLYVLSVIQPFSFLFLSILECLAISNQVFSARSMHQWSKQKLLPATAIMATLGMAIVGLLAGIISLSSPLLTQLLPVATPAFYSQVLPLYFVSMLPFIMLEMCNSALRGQSKSAVSMMVVLANIALNAAICYYCYHVQNLGFWSVIIANALSASLLTPIALLLVRQTGKGCTDPQPGAFIPRLTGLLLNVGLPVFASLVILFFSSVLIIPLLGTIGEEYVSAYLVVSRLRMLIVIPAVACGSALAIMFNQRMSTNSDSELKRLLQRGMGFISVLYLLLTVAVYFLESRLVGILSGDQQIQYISTSMMMVLLPAFFITPFVASLQALLEQLDQAKRVLILTVIIEAATVVAMLAGWKHFTQLNTILYLILAFNIIYFIAFGREFIRLAAKIGEKNVL